MDSTTDLTTILEASPQIGNNSGGGHGKIDVFEIDIEVTSVPYKETHGIDHMKIGLLSHSMIIIIAFVIILALLLLCCVTLFLMRRWKKKYYNCLQKDNEGSCDPNCAGSRRPLLRRDRSVDSTSRTSNSSMRD